MRIKRNYIVSKEKDLQARFRGFARAKRAVPLPPFYAPGKSRGSVFWNRGLFWGSHFHHGHLPHMVWARQCARSGTVIGNADDFCSGLDLD